MNSLKVKCSRNLLENCIRENWGNCRGWEPRPPEQNRGRSTTSPHSRPAHCPSLSQGHTWVLGFWNWLITAFTKFSILAKSWKEMLPEPSIRNTISCSCLGHSGKRGGTILQRTLQSLGPQLLGCKNSPPPTQGLPQTLHRTGPFDLLKSLKKLHL